MRIRYTRRAATVLIFRRVSGDTTHSLTPLFDVCHYIKGIEGRVGWLVTLNFVRTTREVSRMGCVSPSAPRAIWARFGPNLRDLGTRDLGVFLRETKGGQPTAAAVLLDRHHLGM